MNEPTPVELAIFDEISAVGADTWAVSQGIEGLSTDPKMFSIMIYRRLWSNHRGFALLWRERFQLEASIILRSGIEAAICLAALHTNSDEFLTLLRMDAAATVRKQQKRLEEEGEEEAALSAAGCVDMLLSPLPEGCKPTFLNWKSLADDCQVPQLYSTYRHLSGTSSHVTGLSVLEGVVSDEETEQLQAQLARMNRRMHLMYMASATLHGTSLHCQMIGSAELGARADQLIARMNEISEGWLGFVDKG